MRCCAAGHNFERGPNNDQSSQYINKRCGMAANMNYDCICRSEPTVLGKSAVYDCDVIKSISGMTQTL
jgi:hypothetical protein